ncbi:FAD-dependent oxidoreductase [Streptomyces coacervatus]|uniref:FAD-dependent oxidoreductase n=1 Tax=Streptomyces coacervatus TaxID=647381 RepID=A0ABP7IRK6_9ACTN|nr:FAD-dependent monooxygenase [Streptomyces coacervatus]MDF2266821.1 FAD-dependent monooxygenase [Streptomyces coacervatus]
MSEQNARLRADVCVIGGGPGGLMLGLQLARRGHRVVVVEQSARYKRHFRGESVSPDSVRLLHRLGLMDTIAARGDFARTTRFEISDGGAPALRVDFRDISPDGSLPTEIPQQVLLEVLAEEAARHPGFTLLRRSSVIDLLSSADGRITGARCTGADGPLDIHADLTVGADGRFSSVLELSGLPFSKRPLGRDVLWFKVPLPDAWDDDTVRVRIDRDRHALMLPTHPRSLRVGLNIPKGGLKQVRAQGLAALHGQITAFAPELGPAVRTHLTRWSDLSLLDIFTTSVPRWSRPGLVLIGDAAHTLSPILGQGVNHALMDALALAPLVSRALAAPDRHRQLTAAVTRFQKLREPAVERTRRTQSAQERAFGLASAPAVRVRQQAYRLVDSQPWLKHWLWRRIYYPLRLA